MDKNAAREWLLARQAELTRQIALGSEAAKPVVLEQSTVGRLSRMDAMQGQALSVEAQRRRKLALTRVTAALQRLPSAEFGDCLRCGEPIAEARLTHDPAVTLCVECAGT